MIHSDKVDVNSLPIKVQSGVGCATLSLKYSLTAGIGFNILNSELSIESGLFLNAPIYNACVTFDPEAPCNLEFTQDFAADAGAFAQIIADVAFLDFEIGPEIMTTFLSGELPPVCLATSTTLDSSMPSVAPTAMPIYTNATATAVNVTSTTLDSTARSAAPIAMPIYTNDTTTAVGATSMSTSMVYHTKTRAAEPTGTGGLPCITGSLGHSK